MRMVWLIIRSIALALCVTCAGCDGTIFRTFDLRQGQSLSIDARQRLVLVAYRDVVETKADGTVVRVRQQIVCTEPSPDAIVARAAAVAGSATSPQVAAALGASMSESAAMIGIRTPTIQLLRDGLFRACEAYMNGALNALDYQAILFNYDLIMTALLIIDAASSFKLPPAVAITAGEVSVDTSGKVNSKEAAAKAGSKPGSSQFAPSSAGYDSQAAKDVLIKIAQSMLDDPIRVAGCVTPDQSETVGPKIVRNEYFHSVCRSMAQAAAEHATAARLRNQLKQQCVRSPGMAICKQLEW